MLGFSDTQSYSFSNTFILQSRCSEDDEDECIERIVSTEELIERLRSNQDLFSIRPNQKLRLSEFMTILFALIATVNVHEQSNYCSTISFLLNLSSSEIYSILSCYRQQCSSQLVGLASVNTFCIGTNGYHLKIASNGTTISDDDLFGVNFTPSTYSDLKVDDTYEMKYLYLQTIYHDPDCIRGPPDHTCEIYVNLIGCTKGDCCPKQIVMIATLIMDYKSNYKQLSLHQRWIRSSFNTLANRRRS